MTQQHTYLVWSNDARSWWRANGTGYTHDVWSAGRYDAAEALKACGMRTWSQGVSPPEVMVLAPEDGRDTFTVDDIREVPALMRSRIDEATKQAIAIRSTTNQEGTPVPKFEIGDQVAMPGIPVTVEVLEIGECEDGTACMFGPETFRFKDPGGLGDDWEHTGNFEKVEA